MLPNITAHGKISQVFLLYIHVLKAINWRKALIIGQNFVSCQADILSPTLCKGIVVLIYYALLIGIKRKKLCEPYSSKLLYILFSSNTRSSTSRSVKESISLRIMSYTKRQWITWHVKQYCCCYFKMSQAVFNHAGKHFWTLYPRF